MQCLPNMVMALVRKENRKEKGERQKTEREEQGKKFQKETFYYPQIS